MSTFNILENLSNEDMKKLYAMSIVKSFERQDVVFHKEEHPQYLYVLLEGQICICDNTIDGTKNIMTIISEPNDCFGEVYLFLDMPFPFYAEAMKKSKVLLIPRSILSDFPQISANLNVMLSKKAYTLSQKMKILMKDSLKEKIIEYINQQPGITLKRHEMASYLGVSRPALSKELYRMVDEGLLIIDEDGNFKTVI